MPDWRDIRIWGAFKEREPGFAVSIGSRLGHELKIVAIEAEPQLLMPQEKWLICSNPLVGDRTDQTIDSKIFSRVLYQLSYLAWAPERPAQRQG